jgi:DnaJ family protein B protein 11
VRRNKNSQHVACWVQFEHLDGHKVKLGAAEVTIPGQVFRVEKEGMPLFDHPERAGDMYVTITVAFPKKLTDAHRESVRKIFKGFHDEL